jgi:hypothetical protein
MNARYTVLGMALICSVPAVSASTNAAQAPRHGPPACVPAPHCSGETTRRLYFPAQSLSYNPDWSATAEFRGLRLPAGGAVSLSLRRPPDFDDGPITLRILHEVIDDGPGDIWFSITPTGFNHGTSFETYGGVATDIRDAPETLTIVYEHTAELFQGDADGGYGWPFALDWWYFEIARQGSFSGPIRLMSVAIDY